ncbi:hypothetical protein B0H14DRAFT_2584508 [Mycena olivaceomarginata]|nr:hypothetical protein B0H14DRAFT_2584508 [Mycena olivaceomarginata]
MHSVRALHNYETDEIHIRSSGHETVLYNEPRIVRDIQREAPATTELAAAAHVETKCAAHTAHVGHAEGAVEAAHAEAGRAADTAHAGHAEGAVEVAHAEVGRAANTAHAGNAESAVEAAHVEVGCAADTVHADYAEGAVEAAHAEAERAAGTTCTDDAECPVHTVSTGKDDVEDAEQVGESRGQGRAGDARDADADDAEERWLRGELERIAHKREKERVRKAAQLERRAEQALPFPGLGYSPPAQTEHLPRTPRAYPAPKPVSPQTAPPMEARASAMTPEHTSRRDGRSEEDEVLEDEDKRISMLQAHVPWAETRFANYLSVEMTTDAETLPEAPARQTMSRTKVRELDEQQCAKIRQQAANRLWNDTLAAAQQAREKDKTTPGGQHIAAADLRRQKDQRDAESWALHRQLKAVAEILQINAGSMLGRSKEQVQALVTSEVRIRRLRNQLDELRTMHTAGSSIKMAF